MRLSDTDIITALEASIIIIDPEPDYDRISGCTVDLHLSDRFRVFKSYDGVFLDTANVAEMMAQKTQEIEGISLCLYPGKFALGATQERVMVADDLVGWIDGRSGLARLGLMVHATAHRIDPGWDGQIVLEFFNAGPLPIVLNAGMAICAISFETLSSVAARPYRQRQDASYRQQRGPVASRMQEKPDGANLSPVTAQHESQSAALVHGFPVLEKAPSAIKRWCDSI